MVRMGCNSSTPVPVRDSDSTVYRHGQELWRSILSNDRKIIRANWVILQPDSLEIGMEVFQRFFDSQESFKKLFKQIMNRDESGDYIVDRALLENHGGKFISIVDLIIAHLDDSYFCVTTLVGLGGKHFHNGASLVSLWFLWLPLRDTVKHRLDPNFDIETELAWKHLFECMATLICQGHERCHDTVNTEQEKTGVRYCKICKKKKK